MNQLIKMQLFKLTKRGFLVKKKLFNILHIYSIWNCRKANGRLSIVMSLGQVTTKDVTLSLTCVAGRTWSARTRSTGVVGWPEPAEVRILTTPPIRDQVSSQAEIIGSLFFFCNVF